MGTCSSATSSSSPVVGCVAASATTSARERQPTNATPNRKNALPLWLLTLTMPLLSLLATKSNLLLLLKRRKAVAHAFSTVSACAVARGPSARKIYLRNIEKLKTAILMVVKAPHERLNDAFNL